MKLLVRLIEARNIPATGTNGFSEPYVKLQLGKQKFRSSVVKKCTHPTWCEEFTFKVEDLREELIVSVLDEDKYFNRDYAGKIKVPIIRVLEAKDQSLGTSWYKLRPRNKKTKNTDCGEILLTICFLQKNAADLPPVGDPGPLLRKYSGSLHTSPSGSFHCWPSPSARIEDTAQAPPYKEEKFSSTLASRIANIFSPSPEQVSVHQVDSDPKPEDQVTSVSFEEMMKTLEIREQQRREVPSVLSGGVVLDQLYAVAPRELNSIIFSPESSFWKSSAEAVGSTDLQVGPWRFVNGGTSLKRVVSYTKAPSKMVKALKAVEELTYLKGDGKSFVVLSSAETQDAPYGKTFKVEIQYCITPGPEKLGQTSSQLVVSWRINFLQSTMMKGMIENAARQGIKENFDQYQKILSQNVKLIDVKDLSSEKDKVLASLHIEHQSDWKLGVQYLMNLTVLSAVGLGFYVVAHIWMAMPSIVHGLEFVSLDMPDSVSEVMVSGVLVLIGKRALESISRFMHARRQKGSDHGIKARGDGWLLTVALIEGRNMITADSRGLSDPYVVLTCNGMKRTSSTKFQRFDPLWNEIFEFGATEELPSVLNMEVFGFDGPFAEAKSIGRAEINFLKSNVSDLSDAWIPLHREICHAWQPHLHVRIFLENTKGDDVVKDYIAKMEKEVGKKIKLRSLQTNAAFQKLFGLPSQEFLINDFNCNLKRKMPHQGRLFLSPRILGFHSDIFGHKIKLFFLWEDIEDIQVIPPRLSSIGSPIIIIILKPGRGHDARHGAKMQDAEGRLRFQFQSFVSSNVAHRTIMALWRARTLNPEQKARIADVESIAIDGQAAEETVSASPYCVVEEPADSKSSLPGGDDELDIRLVQNEESASFQETGQASDLLVIYSSVLSLPVSFFMELFNGTGTEKIVMERAGCLDFSCTSWEFDKPDASQRPDVCQRQVNYWFDGNLVSHYRGEVSSTQQRSHRPGRNGWLIEEVMTLHGFTLGDCFVIHLKYLVESMPSKSVGCSFQVHFGIAWLQSTRHKRKIAKNIVSNLQKRFKVISSAMEKGYISGTTT